jgi:hypothetical protein
MADEAVVKNVHLKQKPKNLPKNGFRNFCVHHRRSTSIFTNKAFCAEGNLLCRFDLLLAIICCSLGVVSASFRLTDQMSFPE